MFLEEIVEKKKTYLYKRKQEHPLSSIKGVGSAYSGDVFFQNLKRPGINIIAEIKKASPSKGLFREDFDALSLLQSYEKGGAGAVSVLTETDYFLGSQELFSDLRKKTDIPLLRKDFIIEEYQIYESAYLDANALLLIVRILDQVQMNDFITLAKELNMACLVEVHDEKELERALDAKSDIIGVNCRDLKTFQIDKEKMKRVLSLIPENILRIAESGIKNKEDILLMKQAGGDAFLIGETLVRSKDPEDLLREWIT